MTGTAFAILAMFSILSHFFSNDNDNEDDADLTKQCCVRSRVENIGKSLLETEWVLRNWKFLQVFKVVQ